MMRLILVSLAAALALTLGCTLAVSSLTSQRLRMLPPSRPASPVVAVLPAAPVALPSESLARVSPTRPASREAGPARASWGEDAPWWAEPSRPAAGAALAQAPSLIVTPAQEPPRPVVSEGLYTVTRRGDGLAYLKGFITGVPVHVVQADLRDPDVKVGVVVARGGIGRSESFLSMINRTTPAAAITGTFFGLRNGLPTGDLVVNGRAIFRGFVGTALAITDGNVVSFIPTGYNETTHWEMFDTVVRGGPRLVLAGQVAVNPTEEGFRTLAGAAPRSRTAVGITTERKLLLVTVKEGVTLGRLARALQALGAYHAVALDGGASTAMSFGGRIIARPGRGLTNLLVLYADRARYERARKHFYYHARRRVRPSGPPTFAVEPPPAPAPPATNAP